MITFKEQIILIIYFLIFGMFLSAMFDILHYFLNKFKFKLLVSYFIQIIFWSFMVVISCLYMLRISEGYLTIYAFGFFLIGIIIYAYFLRADFRKNLNNFTKALVTLFSRIKKYIMFLIYPKEVLQFIKKFSKKLIKVRFVFIKVYKKIFKAKEVKNINENNEENDFSVNPQPISNHDKWM